MNKGVGSVPDAGNQGQFTKAIVVGISDYMNVTSLQYAHTDALAFYDYLRSDAGGNMDSADIVLLINEQATAANIYAAFDWLVDEADETDRVLIYFSGHGDLETKTVRQNGFLLGYDSPAHCYMAGGTVGVNYLQDYLETISGSNKARIVLITDACRSGKLAGGEEGARNTTSALSDTWENIIKVLSSQPGELSVEGADWGDGAGVFTYYLLSGLKGLADMNKDFRVNGIELFSYLMEHVPAETGFAQNPAIVGNVSVNLSYVDSLTLASLLPADDRKNPGALAQKGSGDPKDILPEWVFKMYEKFNDCIRKEKLIPEYSEDENAWSIYRVLLKEDAAKPVIQQMHRMLLAALQNKSQIIINDFLNATEAEYDFSRRSAWKELDYAFKLVDTSYVLYNHLLAKDLYYQSINTNSYDEKIALLKKADEAEPFSPFIKFALAIAYSKAGEFDSTVIHYRETLELAPQWAYPYHNLANHYYRNNEFEQAISFEMQAIKYKPEFSDAYLTLGLIYYSLNDYGKSIEALNEAVEIDPDNSNAYKWLAVIYNEMNEHSNALNYCYKALKADPKNADAYIVLGLTYVDLEDYKRAEDAFKEAINYDPYSARGYIEMARINIRMSEKDAADLYITLAMGMEIDNAADNVRLGRVLTDMERYPEAVDYFQKAIELEPDNISVYRSVAYAYREGLQDYESALSYMNKAVELEPDNAKNYESIAYIYLRMNEDEESLGYFMKTIELEPENSWYYYNVCCFYALKEDPANALEWLEKALQKGFNDWQHLESDSDIESIRETPEF